ncbi:MAG: MBL fold metallo-hydrolase [bacterium]
MTTRVGRWSLESVPTGDFALDGGAMFGVVPKPLWSREHPADEENRIDMTMRALLLRGEVEGTERIVLVDTGAGDKLTPKMCSIYRIDYGQHDLLGSLAAAGVAPAQVTDVILTHLHFDHCGGGTTLRDATEHRDEMEEGEGPGAVPTFPNAAYHVQRAQWEWAMDPSERDRASFFGENFLPLKEHGQLHLVEGEVELLPDVHLVVVNGHTPGQQLPLIRTMRRTFFYCGDLFPTASHIPFPWIMGYDLQPLETLGEKKRLLPQAVEEEWVLYFEHDAGRECSVAVATEEGYAAGDAFELADCI